MVEIFTERDDPVLLDRRTPKGKPIAPDIDFADPEFPWDTGAQGKLFRSTRGMFELIESIEGERGEH